MDIYGKSIGQRQREWTEGGERRMGLLAKLSSIRRTSREKTGMKPEDIIQQMLVNAQICLEGGMSKRAFLTYQQIVNLAPEPSAQYNLASLYAQGKGTEQNFLQAAYWFHQAGTNGDENGEKMCVKSTMDYIHQDFLTKTPQNLYQDMIRYADLLYPDENSREIAVEKLCASAGYHFSKREYEESARLFRAAAEFGEEGSAQNALAVLYNAGEGVEKNDLAALYWFDRAADNQIQDAGKDRDGLLHAYRTNFTPAEFVEQMDILIACCTYGSEDIPKDERKAAYWSSIRLQ